MKALLIISLFGQKLSIRFLKEDKMPYKNISFVISGHISAKISSTLGSI